MREPDCLSPRGSQWGQEGRQLPGTRTMQSLEEAPVSAEGKEEVLVIGNRVGPFTKDGTNEEIFVDDDHVRGRRRWLELVRILSAEQRVVLKCCIERSLELVGKVAGCYASQDLPVGVGQPWIPGPTPATPLLEKIDRGHGVNCASWVYLIASDARRSGSRSD